MTLLSQVQAGVRLCDRHRGRERLVQAAENYGQVAFLSFKHPQTGAIDRQPFSLADLETRLETVTITAAMAFRADPEIMSLIAEAYRLQHAYLFKPLVEADEWRRLDTAPGPFAVRVRLPAVALLAEATLDLIALQKLAERVDQLLTVAPELAPSFRVILSAEGQRPDAETMSQLNELLTEIQPG